MSGHMAHFGGKSLSCYLRYYTTILSLPIAILCEMPPDDSNS